MKIFLSLKSLKVLQTWLSANIYFAFCVFINPLQPSVAYLYPPESIRKIKGFLMFSGGIDKQYQGKMG